MSVSTLVIDREIDLSPAIVWDAFIDPVLVSGWLGDAVIDPRPGGAFDLAWLGSVEVPASFGVIERLIPRELLEISTDRHGTIRVVLHPLNGGSRGQATLVTVIVAVETAAAFLPRVRERWVTALDQLEELLRGHPMEWAAPRSGDAGAPSQPRLA